MATRQELEDRVDELEQENAELQDQLDAIADIVAPEDEDQDDDRGTADDDDGEDEDDQD